MRLAGTAQPLTLLFERYGSGFDLRHGGGVERALHELSSALNALGVRVSWYQRSDCTDTHGFAELAEARAADAVFPLGDNPFFWRSALSVPDGLRERIVRIWHDVGPLTHGRGALVPCGLHGGDSLPGEPCSAAHTHPGIFGRDVFFRDEPWTRCFPNRRYIPWAVDHLPAVNHRARSGPVLLLAGKSRLEWTVGAVDACRRSGVPVRVIFSGWSTLGRQAKTHFSQLQSRDGCEVIEDYRLEEDHARVFGGVSAALVLSQYHETYNFLAAECVHFGLPVIALQHSGATRSFASLAVGSLAELQGVIDSGLFRDLKPLDRHGWGWRNVASAYVELVRELRSRTSIEVPVHVCRDRAQAI